LAVDDHPSVRQGLALLFGGLDDVELLATVETGEEALEAIERLQPEVVIMDVRLPGIDGISAVKRIQQVRRASRAWSSRPTATSGCCQTPSRRARAGT
jgi:DNA-binding NarL/FixJ family response regulator